MTDATGGFTLNYSLGFKTATHILTQPGLDWNKIVSCGFEFSLSFPSHNFLMFNSVLSSIYYYLGMNCKSWVFKHVWFFCSVIKENDFVLFKFFLLRFSILTKSVDIVFQLPLYSLFVLNNTPGVFLLSLGDLWVSNSFVQKYCIQFCFINNLQDLNILKFCKILLFFRNKTLLHYCFSMVFVKKKRKKKNILFFFYKKVITNTQENIFISISQFEFLIGFIIYFFTYL